MADPCGFLVFTTLLVLWLQVSVCSADGTCNPPEICSATTSWTSLWYVWLILFTIFLLLLCGVTASCVRFCCRKKKPPAQPCPAPPYEVTVIAVDNESTIHSTVTSYSSVQYPHIFPFREVDRSSMSPPAYSLYALELPPAYEEAIKMGKPGFENETAVISPKLTNNREDTTSEEQLTGHPRDECPSEPAVQTSTEGGSQAQEPPV
ncbi:transmembrane protein 52 [Microcaecilia unicolor]|uniref:Transmembrane protein 52 n=1 Tax=Microcaecilia unicolor TaxID=1415580 RepID=A0A6P7WEF2_9AMPH|nr:transmembrane protein 52 [Microcaecilia unicolor]